MRMFIDVGGHTGETVEAVLDPAFAFDAIYSFEPVPACADQIRQIEDPRVHVIEAGLLDRDVELELFSPGGVAGSIHKGHTQLEDPDHSIVCTFRDAATFFEENVSHDDFVVVKLNCEGSECAVIDRLIEQGQIQKVDNALIDFDIVKVKGGAAVMEATIQKMESAGFDRWYRPEDVQYGFPTHIGGIQNWLDVTGVRIRQVTSELRSLAYNLSMLLRGRHMAHYKFKVVRRLPKGLMRSYYAFRKS